MILYLIVALLAAAVTLLTRVGKINPNPTVSLLAKLAVALVASIIAVAGALHFVAVVAFQHAIQIGVNAIWDKEKKPIDNKSLIGKWLVALGGNTAGEVLFYVELLFLILLVL